MRRTGTIGVRKRKRKRDNDDDVCVRRAKCAVWEEPQVCVCSRNDHERLR